MNIFVLDNDPDISAQYLCDQHVVKMIVESAQLLSNSYYYNSNNNSVLPPYKLTHKNHPCSIWVRSSLDNYLWLLKHLEGLKNEFIVRYKHDNHKTFAHIDFFRSILPEIPIIGLTEFVQAMPDKYKVNFDPIKAYRNYYKGEKLKFAKYERRLNGIPKFLINN